MKSKKIVSSLALLLLGTLAVTACDGPGGEEGANNGANPGNGNGPVAPVVRAPQPKPIQAVFTQATFTTEYTVEVDNPDRDELTIAWVGPPCGVWVPENKVSSDAKSTSKMSWNHASPPCPTHSHHDDVTISMVAVGKRSGRTVQCIYRGAETGTGPTCFQSLFNGSEIGPDSNAVHIRYHLPSTKQCSRVELIQVLSVVRKGPPDRIVIPHNDGMDPSEPSMGGYQVPLQADDADGYVVDKFYYSDISEPDPYYAGAVKGNATTDAELDDRPQNTRDGHKAIFEVCAFCSGNPTDAEYGNYLDCVSWEHDADSGLARKTDPQPTQMPSAGFRSAVSKWNENKKFTMPAKPVK
jgi:hypothetical protein